MWYFRPSVTRTPGVGRSRISFTIQGIVALHHAEAIKQVRSRFITHTFSGKNTCGMSEWTAMTKIYKFRTNKYDNA